MSKSIHIAPSQLDFRVFNGEVDVTRPLHEMNDPYDYFFTASIDDNGVARLKGVTFTFTVSMQRDLAKRLLPLGVRRAEWRHDGVEHGLDLKNARTRRR